MADRDLSRPFIGYRPAGRRPERQQDRAAAANAPLAALRGMVSGVLGAPGDIESLVRLLPGLSEQTVLPTSEDIEKRLPLRRLSETPAGRAFTTAGQLGGGFYTGPGSPLRAVAALPSAVSRAGRDFVMAAGQAPVNVVKPRGGNWLLGSVEQAIDPLRQTTLNEVGLRNLAERAGADVAESVRVGQQPQIALNRWVDTKLAKYLKNEMGTPEDPVRALAERGVLHYEPQGGAVRAHAHRELAGMPTDPTATGALARAWEDAADAAILPGSYAEHTPIAGFSEDALRALGGEYAVKNPQAMAYSMDTGTRAPDLGFGHLLDELRNAMAPDSILPAALRLTPEKLDKVTMPQAVELVDKINKWRSAEAAKAEKLGMMQNLQAAPRLLDNEFQLSFVDKPGARWVDIPETVTDEGVKLCTTIGKQGGWCTQSEGLATAYGSGDNRLVAMLDAEGRPHVQAKISTGVHDASRTEMGQYLTDEEAIGDQLYRNVGQLLADRGYGDPLDLAETVGMGGRVEGVPQELMNQIWQLAEEMLPKRQLTLPDITELKPVANSFRSDRAQEYAKRDPEYFRQIENSVLKFLNEGQWGRVADLDYYGIVRIAPDSDLGARLQASGVKYPEFVSQRQLSELLDQHGRTTLPSAPEGFAAGGLVKGYQSGGLVDLEQKYQSGGRVRPGAGLPEPTLVNLQLYADTVARQMFPQERENEQRDAARHMLAAALATQKTTPGVAEFLGKAHEFKEAPLRTAGHWLGLSAPRADYETDIHNNALGVELGRDKRTLQELLDAVETAARSGTAERTKGRAALQPDADTRYAAGGLVSAGAIPYEPAKIDAIVNSLREELNA